MIQAEYDLLERHFDTAFAAPEGIARLRELILTLAMHGKLVEQDPNDPSASELLKTIEKERQQLVKAGKVKKPKALPPIEQADASYALPKEWIWTHLGNIGNIFNGNSINSNEKVSKYTGVDGLPYIATKDIGYGLDALNYKNGVYIPESEEKFKIARQGAVLICAEGGSAGKKCGITQEDICFGNKLYANEPFGGIKSRFILYLYLSPVFRDSFRAAMTGIIGGVSMAKFLALPVPLPPLKEQDRIVAKVDQLMERCDELEKLRKEREGKRLAVHAAAIEKLLDVPKGSTWGVIQQHFGKLYTVKENVAELRKTILALALKGQITQRNIDDESAELLIEKIFDERKTLVKAGKLKKQSNRNTLVTDSSEQIPHNWVKSTVGEIAHFITDGTHKTPTYVNNGIRFVSAKDIREGYLSFDECKYISESEHKELTKRCNPEFGDILISKSGSIGTVVIVEDNGEFSLFESLALVKVSKKWLNNRYIYYALQNACYSLQAHHIRGVAVKHLHLNVLRGLPLPLPPLSEQNRIAEKIDQLMSLCDNLDQQIDATTAKQSELLKAVMAQV